MSVHKQLGFWETFCIAAGAMISSGLFVLPGLAFATAGPAVIFSYGLAGLMVIPALLCQAELATAMPRAGGNYLHVERSLGTFAGTFAGLASWFAIALKAAFALLGMGAFARLVWPDLPDGTMKLVALGGCGLFTLLNVLTVKGVGRFQVFMVGVLLAVLIAFVGGGATGGSMQVEHFRGFFDAGAKNVLAAAGLVFVSFGGLLGVANIAGEVRRPGRTLPKAMFAALAVVTVLYVAAVLVTVGVTEPEVLAGNLTPLSLAAETFWGRAGLIILAAAAMLAYITTANGAILEASRAPLAMSSDNLLPPVMTRSRANGVPWVAVLVTGAFMAVVIAALSLENLVKVASTMLLLLYLLTCLAVVVLRTSRIQNYRPPFRVPFYPYMPLAGIVMYVVLIADMGVVPLATTGAFAAAGLVWYFAYVRRRTQRQSALVYLVRKIVSREFQRSDLEDELRHIATERDEISHDRFDRLLRETPILDLAGPTSKDKLFARAAELLADRIGLDAADIVSRLAGREKQSSTVLQPGLAVPHIIVPGENIFEILPVRCKGGIIFDPDAPYVKTCFLLLGSSDERNYHLRALMAIAQIVQEKGFLDRWLTADDAEHLRDLLLMSDRSRDA
jgi:basic amino acid/polyamine antiporter, APA family